MVPVTVDPEHTLGGHDEIHASAPTDRARRVLYSADIARFVENVGSTQASFPMLCKTCRKHVHVEHLTIRGGVPPLA